MSARRAGACMSGIGSSAACSISQGSMHAHTANNRHFHARARLVVFGHVRCSLEQDRDADLWIVRHLY